MQQDVENANAISLFQNVVHLNDAIEDEGKWLENLVRGIFVGNIFDLGAPQVRWFSLCNFGHFCGNDSQYNKSHKLWIDSFEKLTKLYT